MCSTSDARAVLSFASRSMRTRLLVLIWRLGEPITATNTHLQTTTRITLALGMMQGSSLAVKGESRKCNEYPHQPKLVGVFCV